MAAQRVLIVEDDPLISRMYQRVFEFEGFETDMARNGEEGLQKLKEHVPVMILLDIMMPKMSGIDVLKELKADPKYKGIPVVVLTNLSGSKDAEEALELGAVKFLVKSDIKPKQIVKEKPLAREYAQIITSPVNNVDWWDPLSDEDSVGGYYQSDDLRYEVAVRELSNSMWTVYLAAF